MPCLFVFFQSGETEPLDLGAPISSLDGLRVVLERADPAAGKGNATRHQKTESEPKEGSNCKEVGVLLRCGAAVFVVLIILHLIHVSHASCLSLLPRQTQVFLPEESPPFQELFGYSKFSQLPLLTPALPSSQGQVRLSVSNLLCSFASFTLFVT